MLYGKVLRPPTYNAELESVDLNAVKDMKDVVVVRDGAFVGCAAPTSFRAGEAIARLSETAEWTKPEHPSSKTLSAYWKENATIGSGRRRSRDQETGDVDMLPSDSSAGPRSCSTAAAVRIPSRSAASQPGPIR